MVNENGEIIPGQSKNTQLQNICHLFKLDHHVTSSPPCPPRSPHTCHPLRSKLLPQLPLQLSCHLPPLRRNPRLKLHDSYPRDQALRMSSDNARAYQPSKPPRVPWKLGALNLVPKSLSHHLLADNARQEKVHGHHLLED